MKKHPTQAQLILKIKYDRDTGIAKWIGGQWGGQEIGSILKDKPGNQPRPLLCGCYGRDGKFHQYRLHRLIWILVNGDIPSGMIIDHRDGNCRNNRLSNLRLCTSQQNAIRLCGVIRKKNHYEVTLRGKYFRYCKTEAEATKVRMDAEIAAYGEFSPLLSRPGRMADAKEILRQALNGESS